MRIVIYKALTALLTVCVTVGYSELSFAQPPEEQPTPEEKRKFSEEEKLAAWALENEEKIGAAVKWMTTGDKEAGSKVVKATISVIGSAYPIVGVILTVGWEIVKSQSHDDPVQDAFNSLNSGIAGLEQRLEGLESAISAVRNEAYKGQNISRQRSLLKLSSEIRLLAGSLQRKPVDPKRKGDITDEAQEIAKMFLPTHAAYRDLWYWSDLLVQRVYEDDVYADETGKDYKRVYAPGGFHTDEHGKKYNREYKFPEVIFTDENGKKFKLVEELLAPSFKVPPTFDVYVSALVLYMAAIEYETGGDPAQIMKNYGKDLKKHAAFLSVLPTWRETDDGGFGRLPEQTMRKVACFAEPVSRYPTDRTCNVAYFCNDHFRRSRTNIGSSSFQVLNNQDMCMMSVWEPRPVPPEEQDARVAEVTKHPRYGSDAMALWESWGGTANHVAAEEREIEDRYGLRTMTILADRLARLAKFGTAREPMEGRLDNVIWSIKHLYAVKPNGDLVAYKHLSGVDNNPPKSDPRWIDDSSRIEKLPKGWDAERAQERYEPPGDGVEDIEDLLRRNRDRKPVDLTGAGAKGGSLGGGNPTTDIKEWLEKNKNREPVLVKFPKKPGLTHKMEGPQVVASGWQNPVRIIPAGRWMMYAQTADGVLKLYSEDATKWSEPIVIGPGWNSFSKLVGGGDGVIYGIFPDGGLRWHRHTNIFENYPRLSPKPVMSGARAVGVGTDWSKYLNVFSGGQGVLYAVTSDGRLLWYRHKGFVTGDDQWEGPHEVDNGWQKFSHILSADDGVIYAVTKDGTVLWYQHDGFVDGTARWQGPTQVATQWNGYPRVFTLLWGTPFKNSGPN